MVITSIKIKNIYENTLKSSFTYKNMKHFYKLGMSCVFIVSHIHSFKFKISAFVKTLITKKWISIPSCTAQPRYTFLIRNLWIQRTPTDITTATIESRRAWRESGSMMVNWNSSASLWSEAGTLPSWRCTRIKRV